MTVVTDNKKRVTLRLAKPGDRFDVQAASDGIYILTRLEPVQPRVLRGSGLKNAGSTMSVSWTTR